MKKGNILIPVVVIAIAVGIGSGLGISSNPGFFESEPSSPANIGTPTSQVTITELEDVQEGLIDEVPEEAQIETTSFSGAVIAGGEKSPYIRYNKADFDKARSEGKAIYLYYYATWCGICAAERPGIFQAFNELEHDDAVGFEVHWNDGQNTPEDNNIAREFGVGSQHTHVYIDKEGNLAHKTLLPSSAQEIKDRLTELANL